MRRLTLALLVLSASTLAAATRLPQNVVPRHYAITIAPDLVNETFSGDEMIDVDVKEPVKTITLHEIELEMPHVTIISGSKVLAARVAVDAKNETATLTLPEEIPAGPAAIRIVFEGKLGKQLSGLYLSRTAKRKYAVTQFESTSARRAFPCFDEPAMKATFDITLIVDDGDTAISNGAIVSDTPRGSGKHAIRFATTKRMSSYLVALLVGDFQCISGGVDGIPIRVCSTPGLQHLGQFALQAAEASISFFDQYYGIRYPFGKLDLIGIPDFAAGAMENVGAVTFRETDLLVDEKTASELAKKRVAEVVAHEIAHQWFGDLVTMQWWNDIWLNEGFATFMSAKPLEVWKPQWHEELERPVATNEALTTDAQRATQPIRTPANAEGGFGNSGIIYGKTASVLRMTEEWIGRDQFRDAIRAYLKTYAWGNAAAEDFWASMKASSNQPIDVVLESFIDRTGVPLLHLEESCEAGRRRVTIAEDRLLPANQKVPEAQTWTIPICAHTIGAAASQPCQVVTKANETLTFRAACERPLFLSRSGSGYFVADYPTQERDRFRSALPEFTPSELISYNGTEWLLVRTMHRDIAEYLRLVRAIPRPAPRPVVSAVSDALVFIDQRLVSDQERAAWRTYVAEALRGFAPFTWTAPAGETVEQRIGRAAVLWALGYTGDERVIAGARKVAEEYMTDPKSVDAVIADRALRIAAMYGDDAFVQRVIERIENAPTPELAGRYRNLLPLVRDEKARARATDYIYSEHIRTQDVGQVASAAFADPATRGAAWAALKSRWDELTKRAPGAVGRIANAASSFCDPESRNDVQTFLAAHPVRGGRGMGERTLEAIDTCIAFRAAQQQSFDAALAGGH
jgi:aminopeptidase N/puromycin-sensitive aminopeptidase